MNIWHHNYLFEHPNTTDQQGCPYILPGEQFTQMDDFFITLKEFIIICRQTNYIPQIDAHVQIYQQYEQILLKELEFPNGVCLHKQYFIIRQLSNHQMELRLLPFNNCTCQKQLSSEQVWHKLKKLSKQLFQFQQSNQITQKILDNLTQSIKQQVQSQMISPTINFYDFRSVVHQKIIIFTTDLDLYDKTGLSMIFRLLSLREGLEQGQIIEIIDKYKQIRDKFKLWYSQYLNDVINIIRQQLKFQNQDHYLSIDHQFQYKFQQETIAITQYMLRSQRNQEEIDLIIKKTIKVYTKRHTVLLFENLLDKLSKQMEK